MMAVQLLHSTADNDTILIKKYLFRKLPAIYLCVSDIIMYKKLSYCWETVRRESMPRIAEMDVEMTT